MQRSVRMKKEVQMLTESPPHGISCWIKDDTLFNLEAQILGGEDTPYAGGVFKLEIQIPDRYPFEPPKVRFVTPIYHPNIDTAGRICLDTLKMPPKGAWKPILNISTVLTSIQLLMAEPNPEDPLMTDISNEFTHNRSLYVQTAREWTNRHAKQKTATEQHGNFEAGDNLRDNVYADGKTVSSRKRSLPMDDVTNIPAKLP
ncbi:ubiquitin-conjugating enzyme E2 T-like [Dreissena polymorpha]|uniref:Ubiquitin-conjugating enzyme E2 T n=1 Tax=Dreissena polymorpha TaxID=45954 RepID=A0A9D4N0P4_DREPO|nr:ubiquitin-conjugating enzyme E2 T-like [Dreissena polymorpha]KAH3885566.1 hypothetical protein DPMN_009561 [Dreissena polymorpha]